jgi:hypothetical protein
MGKPSNTSFLLSFTLEQRIKAYKVGAGKRFITDAVLLSCLLHSISKEVFFSIIHFSFIESFLLPSLKHRLATASAAAVV